MAIEKLAATRLMSGKSVNLESIVKGFLSSPLMMLLGVALIGIPGPLDSATAQDIPQAEKDRIARGTGAPQASPQGPPPPFYRSDNFMASARHPNASGFWIGTYFRSAAAANAAVLEACAREMGSPCQSGPAVKNGWIVVAADEMTQERAGFTAATKGEARRAVRRACKERGHKCKIIQEAWGPAFIDFVGRPNPLQGTVEPPPGDFRVR